jgi:probable HAF family extracellular repeat protein
MGRVRASSVAVVMGVGLLGMAGAAPAGPASAGAGQVTVTVLRDGDGRTLYMPSEVNARGQVAAMTRPDADGDRSAVLWSRGRAVHVAPDAATGTWAADLSDRGEVVGHWVGGADRSPAGAFSWLRGRWTELTAGDERGVAAKVNERGQVLGARFDPRSPENVQDVVWGRDGAATAVPAGLVPVGGLNDRGQVLVLADGSSTVGYERAAVWQVGGGGDGVTPLGSLGGDPAATFPNDINQAGHVAGYARTAGGETHGFLWRDGEMVDLALPPGIEGAHGLRLNGRDEVIGTGTTAEGRTRGWLWRDGETIDLGTLGGGYAMPTAINDRGEVVGESETETGAVHAFLWRGGEMLDLGTAGAERSGAIDINDRGQILGNARDDLSDDSSRAVLWTVR